MADNGIGASLVIPQSVLDKLDIADQKVKQLEKTTESASKAIIASFANAADGINPFISKLNAAQAAIDGLKLKDNTFAAISEGAKAFNKELDNTTKKASSAANEVSKVIQQSNTITAKPQKYVTAELDLQRRKYEELKKSIAEYNRLASTGGDTFVQKKQNEENVRLLSSTQALISVLEKEEAAIKANKVAFLEAIASVNGLTLAQERSKNTLASMAEFYSQQDKDMKAYFSRRAKDEKDSEAATRKRIATEAKAAKDRERQLDAEAKEVERLNKLREKERLGTFSGAMSMSENTINENIAKVKQLQIARGNLSKTDTEYTAKLKQLNDAILRLNRDTAKSIAGSKELQNKQTGLINTSDQLARKLALVFSISQIEGYVMNMIRVRGEFELQNKALQAILQNKEQANQLFDQITKLAVQSPFQLKELVTYTKQLAAYRVETEKLYDTTKMLADISAGLGVGMDRLILAYGQVKAANYLRGTELRQFSEAGINILGELSKYFTELEGNIVSVGDVFERVTKRMVKFEDVEEIFKRLTNEGGIFYRMQELQAETVAGQISNLQDSLDIMFNTIGEANEGSIKTALSAVRALVDNWEILANVLKAAGAGFVVYTAMSIRAGIANKAFTMSTIDATIKQGGLQAALARTKIAFSGLFNFVKTNPITLIATAFAMAGYTLYDHYQKVEETKKKYDTLSDSIARTKSEISVISNRYKDQANALKEAEAEMSKYAKGTDEYKDAQERANKASKQMQLSLNELAEKQPDIYGGLKNQKDGTVDLAKAQEQLNKQLELTNYLNYLARETEGLLGGGFIGNVEDLTNKQNDYNKQVRETDYAWLKASGQIGSFLASSDDVTSELKKQLEDVFSSSDKTADKVAKTIAIIDSQSGSVRTSLKSAFAPAILAYNKLNKASGDVAKEQMQLGRQVDSFAQQIKRSYDLTTEEGKKAASESLRLFIESLNIQEKAVLDFVSKRFEVSIGVNVATKAVLDQYSGMQKNIKEFIERNKLSIDVIKPDQSETEYFSNMQEKLDTNKEKIEQLSKATERLHSTMSNEEYLEVLKKENAQLTLTLDAYGVLKKERGDKKEISVLKERISLIKKVNSEYESLLKNYDKEAAKLKVVESYKDAFKEAGLGEIITSMDFDKQGTIDAIKNLSNKAGKEGAKEIEKSLAGIKASMGLDIQLSSQDKLQQDIERMFTGYELSMELEKLNLPADFSAQLAEMFNLKYINLEKLQEEINKAKPMFEELGTEGIKAWESYEKKATELQNNAIKERMKDYSNYLKQTVSERVKIELEAQKKLAEIPSQFSESQKNAITENILKEKQQQLDKIAWEDFKSSDLYIKMFEDIDFVSTKTLQTIRERLVGIKDSLKELTPEQLKEIARQMEKIDEVVYDRDPFSKLIPNIKEYIKLSRERNDIEKNWVSSENKEQQLKTSVEQQEMIVENLREEYNKTVQLYGLNSSQANIARRKLDEEQDILDTLLKQLVAQGKISQEYADQLSKIEGLQKGITASLNKASQYFNDLSSGINDVADGMESIFGTFDDKTADVFDSISEISQALGQTASGFARVIASGGADIGGWIQGIGGLFTSIGAVFNIGDKKRERQIRREIENVERLERAYQKLEEAISGAYDINTLTASTEAAQANIKAQIASYKAMIAAENDKKKTDKDKIKEWENKIEDLIDVEKQLQEELTSQLGGFGSAENFKSASDEFVDAWLSAFRETGNGLEGLQDKFDEWLQQTVQKQMMLKLSNQYIKPIIDSWDKMVSETSPGGVELTEAELKALKELMDKNAAEFDEAAKKYLEQLGLLGDFGGGGKELSGLSKGIQSVTETTAQALEALLNSMRFFVSDSNMQLKNIYNILFDNSGAVNPMLAELKLQTVQITSINKLLNSVLQAGHSKGGQGLKVFIS